MFKKVARGLFQTTYNRNNLLKVTSHRFQSTDYSSSQCEGLIVEPKNQVLWIRFNRPEKYNALTRDMYCRVTETLEKVNEDQSIKTIVLTGTGNFYSSGNDLNNLLLALRDEGGPRSGLSKSKDILIRFVDSLINLRKLLVAAVNGPAIGIAVSTLPLCDLVISSDKATFQTPFTSLGQCPEACSSLTFPKIMGSSRANELLLLNMTWSAKKAQSYGLISDVIEHDKFQPHLEALLYGKHGIVNNCYPHSLMESKALSRDSVTKQRLMDVNRRESEALLELWLGKECEDAVQKFFSRSKK